MKIVILAGGLGTRLQQLTEIKPKPMIEIGGQPVLWHIMKHYATYGFNEFVITLGYKGEIIKDYFLNHKYNNNNLSISLKTGRVKIQNKGIEDWNVHLIDTGLETPTGGRIRMAADYVGSEPFMLTYGDGVSTINIKQLIHFHQSHGKHATVSAVHPPARFGEVTFNGNLVSHFKDKPQIGEGWINGGFFVLNPDAIKYIQDPNTPWEHEPMEHLAADGQLAGFKHDGFWQCMDTIRDVKLLQSLWEKEQAPWKIWD